MSSGGGGIFNQDTIHVIAEGLNIGNVQEDAAVALASDLEFQMREILQVSQKTIISFLSLSLCLYVLFVCLWCVSIIPFTQRNPQDSMKFMKHSKQTTLRSNHINESLRLRNHNQSFGHLSSRKQPKFASVRSFSLSLLFVLLFVFVLVLFLFFFLFSFCFSFFPFK